LKLLLKLREQKKRLVQHLKIHNYNNKEETLGHPLTSMAEEAAIGGARLFLLATSLALTLLLAAIEPAPECRLTPMDAFTPPAEAAPLMLFL
jgi:hypothetical protein